MKKLPKTILTRTIWLGRGTATVMGLAMLLALTVGLTSAALAGTGVGARFHLGKLNAVDAVSTLAGTTPGPMLRISNSSPDNPKFNSPALDLEVAPGNSPLEVNSSLKVDNLNADELDGLSSSQFVTTFGKASDSDRLDGRDSTAFVPTKTYQKIDQGGGAGGGALEQRDPQCDPGDVALNGGFSTVATQFDTGVVVVEDHPSTFDSKGTWLVRVVDVGSPTFIAGFVTCGDLPPLR